MDEGSDLRWMSASNMTYWHHFHSSSDPENSQIWGQLGQWNGMRVHPYTLETAYQRLKHFVYILYEIGKWSEEDVSLKHDILASFVSLLVNCSRIHKSVAHLGQWNGILRVHSYTVQTAYQRPKHFVYVYYGCEKHFEEQDGSLNHA